MLTPKNLKKLRAGSLGTARNKVRRARELCDPKLTQVELAQAIGKTQVFVSSIELGDYSDMTLGTSRDLARVFGCTVDDLFPVEAEAAAS